MGRPSVRSPPKRRLTCPRILTLLDLVLGSTWPCQPPFRPGTSPYPASCPGPPAEGPAMGVPVPCCPSATGVRFLAILCPLGSWASLTVGLPAPVAGHRAPTGLSCFARMRCGRQGALYTPRTAVPSRPARNPRPTHAAFQRPVPVPGCNGPSSGATSNEASSRVRSCSPVRPSPHLWAPGWSRGPRASPELHTPPLPATHVGVGTGVGHSPGLRHHLLVLQCT
jgi:hypothetical protein